MNLEQEKWYAILKASVDFNSNIVGAATLVISSQNFSPRQHKKNVDYIKKMAIAYQKELERILGYEND